MDHINHENLKREFARIGARLETYTRKARKFRNGWDRRYRKAKLQWGSVLPFSADVETDRRGEHFAITLGDNRKAIDSGRDGALLQNVQVLDVQPRDRHLVLQVTTQQGRETWTDKMLMGHDERHWFVAGVDPTVTTGQQAKESLKPPEVQQRQRQRQQRVKRSRRNQRRNRTFIRQGEWFFLPAPEFEPGRFAIISRKEPLRRGGGKPHVAEECCRAGGESVMVNSSYAVNGITMCQYNRLINENPKARKSFWRVMSRNATVYVRGRIRHPDHKTLKLQGWHRVVANNEPKLRTIAFLD